VSSIGDVDELLDVLARTDASDDGEGLSMLAHSLQCATRLDQCAPDDVELVVAGLVHDLGTILEPGQPLTHARTGADAIERLLGPRVARLVQHHDQAKRYLVTVEPSYLDALSEQSVATLAVQGGPMDAAERTAFEATPDYDACIALRIADDAAKIPGRAVPPLEDWRAVLEECARAVRQR